MKKVLCFLLPLFVLSLMLMSSRCKRECDDISNPDCPNYDPCYGKKPVSAAFKIQEVVNLIPSGISPAVWGESLDGDTVLTYGIQFTALEEGAEYEWHIGSEILKTKTVYRENFPIFVDIPITLIVKKTPNKSCFSNDDGIDSLTRNMYRTVGSKSPLIGKFKGTVTNPNDTLTIDGRIEGFNIGGIVDSLYIPYNWGGANNDCEHQGLRGIGTYKKYYLGIGYVIPSCKSPKGLFEIRGVNNDTLVITYQELRTPDSWKTNDYVNRKFVGVRQ